MTVRRSTVIELIPVPLIFPTIGYCAIDSRSGVECEIRHVFPDLSIDTREFGIIERGEYRLTLKEAKRE